MSKRKKRAPRNQPAESPALLVSYVPLLRGKAGTVHDLARDKDASQAIIASLDQTPSGSAAACLWMLDGEVVHFPGSPPGPRTGALLASWLPGPGKGRSRSTG
jgi:hypothetical protein